MNQAFRCLPHVAAVIAHDSWSTTIPFDILENLASAAPNETFTSTGQQYAPNQQSSHPSYVASTTSYDI